VPAPPAAGLPAELLRRRPDIRASERDLAAASADVGVAVAAQYPRLSLSGDAGWNAIQSHALFDDRSEFWSLGPKLSLPLFNSGRLGAQVQSNEAALQLAKARYRKTLAGALADVEVALTRMSRDEAHRQQVQQLQAQQADALRLTRAQFAAGEVARVSLIDAERGLNTAQDQSLQAQGQSLSAWLALYKALGGAP
ncbi:MAG: TolC family protein, partial [Paucibacter sp.]|nr:TolC family protein [Roseateles sp.]